MFTWQLCAGYELMGGDMAPSLVPRLDRSSWQIALQSSFSCSSPWGAVIDDSHCHLDPFSPPIWLLTGRVESCFSLPNPSSSPLLSYLLSLSLSSPFKFKWAHFRKRSLPTERLQNLHFVQIKNSIVRKKIDWAKCPCKAILILNIRDQKSSRKTKLTMRCLQA